jgi:hypothetical protein
MIDIYQESINFGFLFDKTTQVYNALPYEKDGVFIAPNEFVRSNLINKKLEYLHYNYLFLYKLCNYADFIVPTIPLFSYTGTNTRVYEESFQKYIDTSNSSLLESKKAAIGYDIPKLGGTSVFYITQNELITSIIDRDNIDILSKASFIDPLSGSIKFSNATEVKINKRGDLYIVDNTFKNIFLYNTKPALEGDSIYRKLPFIKNIAGGIGPLQEKSKFNNINNIAVSNKFVVVEDDVNKCFKILDDNLNWLNTITLKQTFNEIGKFDCMAIDNFDNLYCVVGQQLYIYVIEEKNNYNIRFKEKVDIAQSVSGVETPLNICFSSQSDYIFYIITNLGVKKLWSTDPSGCIGQYLTKNEILWGDIFGSNGLSDKILLKTQTETKSQNNFKLLGFNDQLDLKSILTNKNFEIYPLVDLLINKEEYVTSWVFQKAIKKIYYNLNKLIKEIKFRLVEDNTGEIPEIIDQIYNKTFLNYTYTPEEPANLSVGLNENFQAEVINRLFQEILDIQNTLLYNVISNKRTKKYFSPAPFKIEKNAIFYDYYGDESVVVSSRPLKLQPLEDLIPLDGIIITLGGAPYRSGEGVSVLEGQFN